MRAIHRAPTDALPPLDAIVARPGPLLSDVYAELERNPLPREEAFAISAALTDSVHEAFVEEAAEIEQHNAFSLLDEAPIRYAAGQDATQSDDQGSTDARVASVVVRHRFDRRSPVEKDAARRIVVLRDMRVGRPRRTDRHGNDPPAE